LRFRSSTPYLQTLGFPPRTDECVRLYTTLPKLKGALAA
jgi:hypothetical protein